MQLLTTKFYTIILYYKNHTYVYQLIARTENEAQSKWAQQIDLLKIGANNIKKIKDDLIADAKEEDEQPGLLKGLKSVWYASICTRNLLDPPSSAGANIVATAKIKSPKYKVGNNYEKYNLLDFRKNKLLYTIQLDYKGGSYAYQVFEQDPLSAKIKWLKEFDFNVVYGIPKNIEAIKNNILSNKNDPDFIPQELKEFDSVWSTTVQLGDEVGRITIVATQTDFLN